MVQYVYSMFDGVQQALGDVRRAVVYSANEKGLFRVAVLTRPGDFLDGRELHYVSARYDSHHDCFRDERTNKETPDDQPEAPVNAQAASRLLERSVGNGGEAGDPDGPGEGGAGGSDPQGEPGGQEGQPAA